MKDFGCSRIVSKVDFKCKSEPVNRYVEREIINRVINCWEKRVREQIEIELNNIGVNIINMDRFIKEHITILRFEPNLNFNYVHLDFVDENDFGTRLFMFDTTSKIEGIGMEFKITIG